MEVLKYRSTVLTRLLRAAETTHKHAAECYISKCKYIIHLDDLIHSPVSADGLWLLFHFLYTGTLSTLHVTSRRSKDLDAEMRILLEDFEMPSEELWNNGNGLPKEWASLLTPYEWSPPSTALSSPVFIDYAVAEKQSKIVSYTSAIQRSGTRWGFPHVDYDDESDEELSSSIDSLQLIPSLPSSGDESFLSTSDIER